MFLVWSTDSSLKPTPEELKIAAGQQAMTAQVAKKFQDGMTTVEGNIVTAMKKRAEEAKVYLFCFFLFSVIPTSFQGPWDQSHFEQLLAKWIAATDQPFSVVEDPEFKALLNYVHHHSARILKLPSADTIQRRIMDMGGDVEKKLIEAFAVNEQSCAAYIRKKLTLN